MKKRSKCWISIAFFLLPLFGLTQITPPVKDTAHRQSVDSLSMTKQDSSLVKMDSMIKDVPKTDAVKPVLDSGVANKDCCQQWSDVFRSRGAKAVPDGMQQVVIALKSQEAVIVLWVKLKLWAAS